MIFSAAIPYAVHKQAIHHLIRDDGQEDICFALWYPSVGENRQSALVEEIIMPKKGERIVNGNAAFQSTYFERSIRIAIDKKAGLALMHSHLTPGWQDMSLADVEAENNNAGAVMSATGLPFVGLTLGNDGTWSARFWMKVKPKTYNREWCKSVRVVGDWLDISFKTLNVNESKFQRRSVSAWGPLVQAVFSELEVGIIGVGSVGSAVAEALARMGVGHIQLIDFDRVSEENLDRTLHSYKFDVGLPKVEVLYKALKGSSTLERPDIKPIQFSICEMQGFKSALDCDILFSCVDRPWPRYVLNFIALSHLIPVIDGGIAIERRLYKDGILRAEWRAHTVTPTRMCLECLGQYEPGEVQSDREGLFDDINYIRNLPSNHPMKRNENVYAFAAAVSSLEILQFISLVVPMPGRRNPGAQLYHFVPAILDTDRRGCKPNCFPHSLVAKGDKTGMVVTDRHYLAETRRSLPLPKRSFFRRLKAMLKNL